MLTPKHPTPRLGAAAAAASSPKANPLCSPCKTCTLSGLATPHHCSLGPSKPNRGPSNSFNYRPHRMRTGRVGWARGISRAAACSRAAAAWVGLSGRSRRGAVRRAGLVRSGEQRQQCRCQGRGPAGTRGRGPWPRARRAPVEYSRGVTQMGRVRSSRWGGGRLGQRGAHGAGREVRVRRGQREGAAGVWAARGAAPAAGGGWELASRQQGGSRESVTQRAPHAPPPPPPCDASARGSASSPPDGARSGSTPPAPDCASAPGRTACAIAPLATGTMAVSRGAADCTNATCSAAAGAPGRAASGAPQPGCAAVSRR
jgi:hypothetical protein